MSSHEKYSVIIGETGSGKSTFINYLANYFNRGSLETPFIAIPTTYLRSNMNFLHSEHAISDKTKSKTTECQQYTFQLSDVYFHFIDTPGINDTGGLIEDSRNVEKIFTYIQSKSELTSLILVLNGAVSRFTINIKNVLAIFRDRLPDAIYSNMIIVLTNCQEYAVNFNPSECGLSEQCIVFYMQNSAFSSDPKKWSDRAIQQLTRDFDGSMKTINLIIQKLLTLVPTSTKQFQDMNNQRNTIQQQLHYARLAILDLQKTEDELIAFEKSSDIHALNAEKFENFIQKCEVTQTERVLTPYHNTICSVCNWVCHQNCTLEEVPKTGKEYFIRCVAMDHDGRCHNCPGRCRAKQHFHGRYITRQVKRHIVDIIDNMQQRYLKERGGQRAADLKCKDLQTAKRVLESELKQQYNQVQESVHYLQETCSNINIVQILYKFIDCLKKDVHHLKSPSIKTKANAFITNLEQLCVEQPNRQSQIQGSSVTGVLQSTPDNQSYRQKPHSLQTVDVHAAESLTSKTKDVHTESSHVSSQPVKVNSSVMNQHSFNAEANSNSQQENECFFDANEEQRQSQFASQPIVPKNAINEKKSVPTLDMTNAQLPAKPATIEMNLAMFPHETLITMANSNAGEFNQKDIEKELKRRCSGQSIGFLTNAHHYILCENFARHQHTEMTDLFRLSVELNDEIVKITQNDPFKIMQVPNEKLLQLSAIYLCITNKH